MPLTGKWSLHYWWPQFLVGRAAKFRNWKSSNFILESECFVRMVWHTEPEMGRYGLSNFARKLVGYFKDHFGAVNWTCLLHHKSFNWDPEQWHRSANHFLLRSTTLGTFNLPKHAWSEWYPTLRQNFGTKFCHPTHSTVANHGPYWHTVSPKSYYGKPTSQVPIIWGGFWFMNPRIHPFFFVGDMRGPHSDSTSKYSESSEKLPHNHHSSFHSYILNPLKAFRFTWPTPIHLLAQPNACFNSSQAVGSPGKTRTTSGERPIFFWKSRVLCKKIGSWNPESIRIHYCHALGESKQQYLGIMAGHMRGKRICL